MPVNNETEKRWDVLIIEDATRKVETVAGTNLPEKGSFHTVGKRLETVCVRINDNFDAIAVPAGKFKKGDVIPQDVEEYAG
jgi:hypothetical protein